MGSPITRRRALAGILAAILAAAAAEGVVAALAVVHDVGGALLALQAFFVTAGLFSLPFLVLAPLVALVAGRLEVRALGAGISSALAGGERGHKGLAVVSFAGSLTWLAGFASRLGRQLVAHLPGHVAAAVTVVVALGSVLVSAILAAFVASFLGPRLARLAARSRIAAALTGQLVVRVVLATFAVLAVTTLVPEEHAATPAAAAVALLLGSLPPSERLLRGLRAPIVWASLVGGSVLGLVALPHVSAAAQMATLYRPPFTSALVAETRALFDSDGDGFSPVLLGGDCDDHDRNVHPGAHDVPGNGVDEDCSGEDAPAYEAPRALPAVNLSAVLPAAPLNIVLLHMDALRPDRLGFAGYPRPTSPNLDAFREQATWFRRAYSPGPSTCLAVSSLFTGQPMERVPQKRGPGTDLTLLPEAVTLADRLGAAGYDCNGLIVPYVRDHMPGLGRGFQSFAVPWSREDEGLAAEKDATLTTDAALGYLATVPEDRARPFFLFSVYTCPHAPRAKHERWSFGDSEEDVYDSTVAYCDDEVGRLLRALAERKDSSRTAIVVYSDHGESFGEHGAVGHGSSLFEAEVRVLLLAKIPGATLGTVDAPVSLDQLGVTLAELGGTTLGESESLAPRLFADAKNQPPERPVYLYADTLRSNVRDQLRGVVDGRYKYVRDLTSGAAQIFEPEVDPQDRHDLLPTLPEERARLAKLLEAWESHVTAR